METHDSPTEVDSADLSGKQLGGYRLVHRLGSGGMADVYLAEQASLRRKIAFKVLRSSLANDERCVRRFHHEAQSAAALVHANIVQIHEVGCLEGQHFIAQEYVAGENLRQLLNRTGPLGIGLVLSIIDQVASALQRAGQQGIVHRDIKPENILLSSGGEVKVADFGLARLMDGQNLELTQPGTMWGTPLYMSPEQIESRPLDPRSDIYSLGVTCYQILTGQPPFMGDTAVALAMQHLQQEPPELRHVRPDAPAELGEIVRVMLAKDPEQRFQSAALLQAAIRSVPFDGPIDWPIQTAIASSATHRTPLAATEKLRDVMRHESVPAPPWRKAIAWSAAVLIAFLSGGVWAWWHRGADPLEAAAKELPAIERREDAKAQFAYAMSVGTARAFRAVSQYFPPADSAQHELYAIKAKLQLAYLYEESDRLDDALRLYEELAIQGVDRQLKIIGLIGEANLNSMQGAPAQANQALYRLAEALREGTQPLPTGERQQWLRRLNPGLRSDFLSLLGEEPNPQ